MKNCVMFILLCLFVQHLLWGKIKNGYEVDILAARQLLVNLQSILEKDKLSEREAKKLSLSQEGKIKAKILWLENYLSYYQLTEVLLEQFKTIAPELYHEIDTIKDYKGRATDVYIKFMPEEYMHNRVAGTTNVAQVKKDQHAYHSEYGARTVSVKIRTRKEAFLVLAHELGHVKYQVPHLSSYTNYCKKYYLHPNRQSNQIGHDANDESGQSASTFEKRFSKSYINYIKSTKAKIITPLALLQDIKGALVTR